MEVSKSKSSLNPTNQKEFSSIVSVNDQGESTLSKEESQATISRLPTDMDVLKPVLNRNERRLNRRTKEIEVMHD